MLKPAAHPFAIARPEAADETNEEVRPADVKRFAGDHWRAAASHAKRFSYKLAATPSDPVVQRAGGAALSFSAGRWLVSDGT
jgi:hypothetical protein